ncbi:hypothetical protein F0562_022948 [Nyssa sinensis]|uniref:non-specific serine/threonine protein kinase n=1 Tax=Nyssa sinensis TaxID=561372 RepID=A0A5J5BGK1_9ASTE|nr:hypothetical protein F0562_022948 [Nyssa sinensis]
MASPTVPVVNTTTPPPIPLSPPAGSGSLPPNSQPSGPANNPQLVALGVGVGLGGAIVLIAVAIFVWYRRRKRRGLAASFTIPLQESKDEHFGGPRQNLQQSAPPPTDNRFAKLPKPTPPPGAVENPQLSPVRAGTPPSLAQQSSGIVLGFSQTTFTYEELAHATDSFSNTNLLGQGGFGYVHKGVLPDGKEVAIKQLRVGSGQGEREFQAEIEIISRVHHRHLVSLVGYCISGAQRLLVYDFVPNNTLEFHLHGKGRPPLNWTTRMKIALGSAKGLAYLHEDCQPKIIHRDIKAANILLDYNFEAKLADFGLARLNSDADTHISTRVMGTFGYLAPEYALSGKLTDKSDIFSYGVVLLELITGRRPIDKAQHFVDDNIVDWARPLLAQALEDGNFDTLADPRLQNDYDSTEMTRMIACAAVCVRHLARLRPRMSQIIHALEGNMSLDELNDGIRPGHSAVYSYRGSSNYDSAQYKEDLIKFRKMALESQEQNPSEISRPTSESGVHPSGSSSEVLQTTQETSWSSEGQQTTQEMEMGKTKFP